VIQPPRGVVEPSASQRVAEARLVYALEEPGGMAVLCGPGGTGVTTVLTALWRRCAESTGGLLAGSVAEARELLAFRRPSGGVLLVDDCHLAAEGDLDRLIEVALGESRCDGIVLGGQGRLLTLLQRSPTLAGRVRLRAVLGTFTADETAAVVRRRLVDEVCTDAALRTIHEISGGVAGDVVRLADLVSAVATAEPNRPVDGADVEVIHGRLRAEAA